MHAAPMLEAEPATFARLELRLFDLDTGKQDDLCIFRNFFSEGWPFPQPDSHVTIAALGLLGDRQ
jgi:hypothetical protein